MSETTAEIVLSSSSLRDDVANLEAGKSSTWSSLRTDDFDDKAILFEALSSSEPVADHLDEVIALTNVVIEVTPLADESTGEIKDQPRVILIDANGSAYHATSPVVFKDVQRLLAVFGHPSSWPKPVGIKVVKVKSNGTRSFFTIKFAKVPDAKK